MRYSQILQEMPNTTVLRIGDWTVNSNSDQISRGGETARLEIRSLRLLLYLAEHAGEVVSIEELLNKVWAGVSVSPDSVYQAVTTLRRALGDDPKRPKYIATVPRLGYRMVAKVTLSADHALSDTDPEPHASSGDLTLANTHPSSQSPHPRARFMLAIGVALCITLAVFLILLRGRAATNNQSVALANASSLPHSIAVLPFLDLTDKMNEEPFADGMTEELIDKLSSVPDLKVPGATSSFYFKGKQIPVADIAKTLGVSYVLDGSVRKSGPMLRVAARLVRADSGYVVWSETYDRPFKDKIWVQDDIASEVTKALRTSIQSTPNRK
jgi:transcriptional activator of cad operon